MLARLNGIGGVGGTDASLGNEGGSLVRVTLRPGADPAKVAEQVRRVPREEVKERAVQTVAGQGAAAAGQPNEWLDTSQLADIAAGKTGPPDRRTSALLTLLLGALGVGLCLLGYRYLRHQRGETGT